MELLSPWVCITEKRFQPFQNCVYLFILWVSTSNSIHIQMFLRLESQLWWNLTISGSLSSNFGAVWSLWALEIVRSIHIFTLIKSLLRKFQQNQTVHRPKSSSKNELSPPFWLGVSKCLVWSFWTSLSNNLLKIISYHIIYSNNLI